MDIDGKIIKLSTTFIQNMFPDSEVKVVENIDQPKLSTIPDSTGTSICNSHNSK
jgi:hypothetical protein